MVNKSILEMPKKWVSASQCDIYTTCPKLYWWLYYKNLKDEKGYDALLGTVLHIAAEEIGIKLMRDQDLEIEIDCRTAYLNALNGKRVIEEHGPARVKPHDIQAGISSLKTYAWNISQHAQSIISVESDALIQYDKDLYLKMIPDIALTLGDDGIWIIDLKNSRWIKTKDELRESPQLNTYGWGELEMLRGTGKPIKRIRLSEYYFRTGKFKSVDINVDDVMYIKDYIDSVVAGIRAGLFPERVNQYCHNCPRHGSCKEYKRRFVINNENIKNPQSAHDEYNKISKTIKLLQIRQADIKAFIGHVVERRGPVQVKDAEGKKVWHYKEGSGRDFSDTPKFIKLFQKYSQDLVPELQLLASTYDMMWRKTLENLNDKNAAKFKAEAALLVEMTPSTVLKCDKLETSDKGLLEGAKKVSGSPKNKRKEPAEPKYTPDGRLVVKSKRRKK